MGQATPADQDILRHQRERGEDPDLDCHFNLRAGGHRPQAPGVGGEPLPDSTDSLILLGQITIYLDDKTERLVKRHVKASGESTSKWVAEAVRQRVRSE